MSIISAPVFGKLPHHLDPFNLNGGYANKMPRLRFGEEGGDGTGAGGNGGDGSEGSEGDDKPLGPAGERAYERTKEELRETKDTLKAFSDLGLSADEIKQIVANRDKDGKSDKSGDKAPLDPAALTKQIREEVAAENQEKAEASARRSEVKTQAALLGFHNPGQALALINTDSLKKVAVKDDEADSAAVKKILEALATESPYLVKNADDETPDYRTAGIGGTGSNTKPEVQPGKARLANAYKTNSKKP